MRESVVFYRSFYEAVRELPPEDFKKSVCAIMNYGLDDKEPETSGIEKTIHLLTKPQIDANNRRYQNGKKGGRPQKYSFLSDDEKEKVNKDRNSQEYIRWRDAVYERDSYTCQHCGSNKDIEAHHKLNFVEYPELRFDVNNGITLCRDCHNQEHNCNNQKKPSENQNEPKEKEKVKEKDNVKDNIKNNVQEAHELFERLWKMYPNKKGKGQVSEAQKKRLLAIGETTLVKAIERYSLELQKDVDWRKPQNGSTFFNSGYIDYLDDNYEPGKATEKKSQNQFNNFHQRSYDYDALEKQLLERSRL